MKDFICNNCNYKFKREKRPSLKCPYCGSSDIKEYKPTLAQDLLDKIPSE